jgi:hypothetical protein
MNIAAMDFTSRLLLLFLLAVQLLGLVIPEAQCFTFDQGHYHSSPSRIGKKTTTTTTTTTQLEESPKAIGQYDPSEDIRPEREVLVGDPQLRVKEKDWSVTSILKELSAIQQQGPQKYCILGTRHCSYLHQQIIELLYVPACCVHMKLYYSMIIPIRLACPLGWIL